MADERGNTIKLDTLNLEILVIYLDKDRIFHGHCSPQAHRVLPRLSNPSSDFQLLHLSLLASCSNQLKTKSKVNSLECLIIYFSLGKPTIFCKLVQKSKFIVLNDMLFRYDAKVAIDKISDFILFQNDA